jgi:hypothetical protein
MNTAELTAAHRDTMAEMDGTRLMANITRRAERLWADGYTALQTMGGQYVACYEVRSPEGRRYSVKVAKTLAAPGTFYGSGCSCPCFAAELTCKHLLACTWREEADAAAEALAAAHDVREASYADADPYEYWY